MVLVVVELMAKEQCVDALRTLIVEALPDTRVYDGCYGVTGFLNEDGRTMALHEQWTSKAHHKTLLGLAHRNRGSGSGSGAVRGTTEYSLL